MKRNGMKKILVFILFGLVINISAAEGKSKDGNFSGEQTAVFGYVKGDGGEIATQAVDSARYIDAGDYYILNTGKKAHFLREERTYFIIYKRKTMPFMTSDDLQNRFSEDIDIIKKHPLKKLAKFKIKKGKKHKDIISALYLTEPTISFISPVLSNKDKGGELAIVPHIIVSRDKNVDPDYVMAELHKYNLSLVSKLAFTDTEYELKMDEPVSDIGKIFELTRTLAELPSVNWAEPNFLVSAQKQFFPDDTLFNDQWHLHNTGLGGGAVDADVDAPEGWDISQGIGTVIAIYDDGVDTSHEDIAIWFNPGETGGGKETNVFDDDGNGFIDDYQG